MCFAWRHVSVKLPLSSQRFEDVFDLLIGDHLCREHFLEQLMAMPDSNSEILSQLVRTEVIRDHNGVSDLTKRNHSAVCRGGGERPAVVSKYRPALQRRGADTGWASPELKHISPCFMQIHTLEKARKRPIHLQ